MWFFEKGAAAQTKGSRPASSRAAGRILQIAYGVALWFVTSANNDDARHDRDHEDQQLPTVEVPAFPTFKMESQDEEETEANENTATQSMISGGMNSV